MSSQKPESRLSTKIIKTLRARTDGWWVKIPGTAFSAGLPDIIGCVDGKFYGLEVKLPGREKTLTARQAFILDQIALAGGTAAVVTSVEEALRVVGVE